MLSVSLGSDLKGPFQVAVYPNVAMLIIRDVECNVELTIFRQDADAIAQYLAIGRAIVEQCEQLERSSEPNAAGPSAVTHDFQPGSYAQQSAQTLATNPDQEYTIDDAIKHEAAGNAVDAMTPEERGAAFPF